MSEESHPWQGEVATRTYLEGIRGAIPFAREQIDIALRLVRAAGIDVRSFADLGCGDGVLASVLLESWPEASGVAVDFSEPMLAAARERLSAYGGRCQIFHADLSTPAWQTRAAAAAPFDVVISGYAIHHVTDDRKRALYGEVLDLLRPGGFFLNLEHVASATPWLTDVFDELLIDGFLADQLAKGAAATREQVAEEYVHRPDKQANILALVEAQCAWLRELGYQDVDCYFKVFELAVFGGRKGAG